MTADPKPLILDFDDSVLPVAGTETRLPLNDWQEAVRFGAAMPVYARMERHLRERLPRTYGCVFTGSGDYHHISLFLLRHLIAAQRLGPESLDVVVCDNHPDNMRYLFGLHCGSWVRHAARLAAVRHIHVLGITSMDISAARAWENYLGPFFRKKLTYWSISVRASWLGLIGRKACAKSFSSPEALLASFFPALRDARRIYLSIDKDVLDPNVVRTNWDQGVFAVSHLESVIGACADRLCGADVCGEISSYTYKSAFKRFLAGLDAQDKAAALDLEQARKDHQALNIRLAHLLRAVQC